MTATRDERLEFAFVMGELGKLRFSEVERLLKLAKAHGKLQEKACNSELSDREKAREAKIEQEIANLLHPSGIKAKFGGDPRGYTVKLILPNKRYNTWGGEEDGWGVPQ